MKRWVRVCVKVSVGFGGAVFLAGNCPSIRTIAPRRKLPPVSFGVWVGLVLWLGATKQLPPGKLLPPRLGLGFELRLVLELGGNFPQGQLS